MLPIDALKDIRPFIATPSYSSAMTSDYVRSLLGLVNLAWRHGFPMQTRFLDGDSLIPRARNRLVAEFMADSRWTHLFWIDADIGFEPEAALRLLLAGRDVVAGAYPLKRDGWPADGLAEPLPAGSTRADFDARHAQYAFNPWRRPDGSTAALDGDGFFASCLVVLFDCGFLETGDRTEVELQPTAASTRQVVAVQVHRLIACPPFDSSTDANRFQYRCIVRAVHGQSFVRGRSAHSIRWG